ncbi:MAG: MFS transporter [Thermoplasmata archaeon]|nr:MFS transporter [Thermoplasmata archaeon]
MEYKWKALAIVNLGGLMGSIDATVLVIGFPSVARELGASLVEMVWVLMIYLVMGTALVLSLGRLSDMKGRKRLYTAGFLVFILGSGLCGFAGTGVELVLFRAIQGVGGAMLIANSFAIVSDAFPASERGRAFGINTIVWGAGSVLGIALGGLILAVTTWRWIFWINLPIGAVATVVGMLVLRESVTPNPKETFDFPAAFLFVAGLLALLFGVTEGILTSWGAPETLGPILLSAPLLVAFVLWEMRVSRDPILPLSLFRSWPFSAGLLATVLQGLALFSTNFVLMIYFQGIRHVSVLTASLLLLPLFLALMVVGPVGGRLSDRYGARFLSTLGLGVQALALLLLSGLSASTPLALVAVYEGMLGVGGGLFFPANTAAIMASSPPNRYGVASGAMMTFRNTAVALSYVLALVALTSRLPAGLGAQLFGGSFRPEATGLSPGELTATFLSGMHAAFLIATACVVAAALFSALRGRHRWNELPASSIAADRPAPRGLAGSIPLRAGSVERRPGDGPRGLS